MEGLNIVSYNVRGLRNNKKRLALYEWVKEKEYEIILLQETHCHLKKETIKWGKEWKGKSIWCKGTSRSKGVTVLFKEYSRLEYSNEVIDPNGRFIALDIKINENKYRIINIYAPNQEYERVKFFNEMNELVNLDDDMEVIIGGDYNCTLENDIDRYKCCSSADVGQIDLKYFMDSYKLEDIWRRRNPTERKYSWEGRGKLSRIDYWLVSKTMDSQITYVDYVAAPFSDHSAVNIKIRTTDIEYGKGLWKMNVSIINSELFRTTFRNIWNKWKEQKQYYDTNIWWDIGKRKVKEIAIWCSKEIAKEKRLNVCMLEKEINKLKGTNANIADINILQSKLQRIYEEKADGTRVRSRIQWWEEGEKSTKYFYQLEKKRGKDQMWDKILNDSGNFLRGTQKIQQRQVEFYESLYKSQDLPENGHVRNTFLQNIKTKLSEKSHLNLDKDISLTELSSALFKMKNNKSLGQDGICVEFYKMYWNEVKEDLFEVIAKGLDDRRLAHSQYLAIIKLLYKKGDRHNVKNWRPISLLNVDFKILSKTFAERIKCVLPEIIHTDQRGCIQGRFIGENIRLIEDIVQEKDDDSVVLLLDQEKAFDRVEWSWMFDVLRKFNFGERFITWIETMYKCSKSAIMTNGHLSKYFHISRGIRQGDAMSALLFIIQSEPLAETIRSSPDIKGIAISDEKEVRISQYVDDTNVFLSHHRYITPCLNIIKEFESVSGSKLNESKTKGLTLHKHGTGIQYGIEMTHGPEMVLGIPVGK